MVGAGADTALHLQIIFRASKEGVKKEKAFRMSPPLFNTPDCEADETGNHQFFPSLILLFTRFSCLIRCGTCDTFCFGKPFMKAAAPQAKKHALVVGSQPLKRALGILAFFIVQALGLFLAAALFAPPQYVLSHPTARDGVVSTVSGSGEKSELGSAAALPCGVASCTGYVLDTPIGSLYERMSRRTRGSRIADLFAASDFEEYSACSAVAEAFPAACGGCAPDPNALSLNQRGGLVGNSIPVWLPTRATEPAVVAGRPLSSL